MSWRDQKAITVRTPGHKPVANSQLPPLTAQWLGSQRMAGHLHCARAESDMVLRRWHMEQVQAILNHGGWQS